MSNKAFLGTACIATCLLLSVGQLAAETRQETALSYIELGNKFMHQGDFDRAISAYNRTSIRTGFRSRILPSCPGL